MTPQEQQLIEKRFDEFFDKLPLFEAESYKKTKSWIISTYNDLLEKKKGEIEGLKRSDSDLNGGLIQRDNYFFNLALNDVLKILNGK